MSYIQKTNTIVLEIPKCGSRSLFIASNTDSLKGHKTLKEVLAYKKHRPNPTVIAVIRNPADRFASAINHHYAKSWPGMSLDQVMAVIVKNGTAFNAMFTPQADYLEGGTEPYKLTLYPFERIEEALAEIGEGTHQNAGTYKWTVEEISAHHLFDQCMDQFREDWKWYEYAKQGMAA